ncbi:MAG TPA: hypothetical protein VFJ58_06730 [Armatimonadota bacterium]|nr:hypothetical protein [Armatimonadota bacterium]
MEQYRTDRLISPETTALTLTPASGPELKIALGGWRSGAALYEDDRRILDVARSPAFISTWRVRQDDILRARIIDRGLRTSGGRPFGLFDSLKDSWDEIAIDVGISASPRRRGVIRWYQALTERRAYTITWPLDGWEVRFFAPDSKMIGKVARLPDGYLVEVDPAADRFLVLGFALFVLLQYYEDAVRVRDIRFHKTVIVNPMPPWRPPRRHRRRRERRRKWIDDPLGDRRSFGRGRYGFDDPLEHRERTGFGMPERDDDLVGVPAPKPTPVEIDDPAPDSGPVRIDDPDLHARG